MSKKRKEPQTIGQRIKAARLAAGWTQAELAEAADIGQGHLSALERTQDPLVVDKLRRIAAALGVKVSSLIDD